MTKSTIKFTKANLERLKFSGKHKYYYAENFEGLCIYVGKSEKTYHAHWSEPIIDRSTGKVERFGKKKRLGGFQIPLEEIKEKVRKNLDDWKKVAAQFSMSEADFKVAAKKAVATSYSIGKEQTKLAMDAAANFLPK